MKKIISCLIVLSILLFVGCKTTDTTTADDTSGYMDAMPSSEDMGSEDDVGPGYIDLSVEEAKQLMDENPDLIIIDVSPNYYDGHLPGAVNYYLGDGSLEAAIPTLDKEATYLVYCHSTSVSIEGAKKLVGAGITKVYRLEGNYQAWVDAGYPVE